MIPDDLFSHLDDGDEFDMKEFNKDLHGFKILPDLPVHESLMSLVDDFEL